MTLEQALEELTPYSSEIPKSALEVIRSNWQEAEPILLDELDRCIEQPLEEDSSAFFLYALYLCAEMRSEAAFDRYVRILRLPNLLIDHLIGDIMTQSMDQMLARTCATRSAELKALVEDETVYEFARSSALLALQHLVVHRTLAREEMERYCIDLLTGKLERYPSYAWDAAVSMAMELDVKAALPLIETAYRNGLADPIVCSLEEVRDDLQGFSRGLKSLSKLVEKGPFESAQEMGFFRRQWKEMAEVDPEELLQEPREQRRERSRKQGHEQSHEHVRSDFGKVGRNQPCPCGSGKKFKKCCINRIDATKTQSYPAPLNSADEWIAAGHYYLEKKLQHRALACWWQGWQEVKDILPEEIQDPKAEECIYLFPSSVFFGSWLEEYQSLLEKNLRWDADIVHDGLQFCLQVKERFPLMDTLSKNNLTETTVYLLLALGRSVEAFSLLEQMIRQHPDTAQGYAVWAALLSVEAHRFQLHPDFDRARGLLQQALEHADDCEAWDVESRLNELHEQ